jgi:uronate dehydrogenase
MNSNGTAKAKRVLLPGAAGGIGTMLRRLLKGVYAELRLSDIAEPNGLGTDENFVQADLADMTAVEKIVEGVDGIIHLGGVSIEKPWEMIHQANIVGGYNLFEAARREDVKRVVFASSNHAVGFYRRNRRIGTEAPVRPDSRYGVSKAFGEALGALYSDKHGMSVTCLRIGNVGARPLDVRRLSIWISPEDIVQLISIGLNHPDIRFEILYGASNNEAAWWDNSRAQSLGYRPKGRAEDHRAHAEAEQAKIGPDPVGDVFQGGTFCASEFTNDVKRAGP